MSIIVDLHPHNAFPNGLLKYAIVPARHRGKWIFCRHKQRDTYELPAGHREPGELIGDAASRELMEETGATEFSIEPVCVYSATVDGVTTYGKLFYAGVSELGPLSPDFEIGEIILSDTLPQNLTYPEIQPVLFAEAERFLQKKKLLYNK